MSNDLSAKIAALPPDAIAQVVNAWRDGYDLPLGDTDRAARAFREALLSVLGGAAGTPGITDGEWLLLEMNLARATDELKRLPELRREDELLLVEASLLTVRDFRKRVRGDALPAPTEPPVQLSEERPSLQPFDGSYPKWSAEELLLRKLLWLRHGCIGLYGDDGEMQCAKCMIDFLRESPREIERRFFELGTAAVRSVDSLRPPDGWPSDDVEQWERVYRHVVRAIYNGDIALSADERRWIRQAIDVQDRGADSVAAPEETKNE